jgi:hypothetical protein
MKQQEQNELHCCLLYLLVVGWFLFLLLTAIAELVVAVSTAMLFRSLVAAVVVNVRGIEGCPDEL